MRQSNINAKSIIHLMRGGTIRAGTKDYSTILTPAARMSPNREANADAYATVKPRIAFAPIRKIGKGEHIAAEVDSTSLCRASITGGEIDKSGNIQKHREVCRENTWNCWREAADESRMSGESIGRGVASFGSITANIVRTDADEVRFYFIQPTKGDQQMKTKLDTMNHAQRAAFARSLYNPTKLTINAATSVTKFTIRMCA